MKKVLFTLFFSVLTHANEICPICLKAMSRSTVNQILCCRHSYHVACIGQSLRDTSICPECRVPVGLHTDRFKLREHDCCETGFYGNLVSFEQYAELLSIMQDDSRDMSVLTLLYIIFEQTTRRYPSNSEEIISIVDRIREAFRDRASRDVDE